MAIGDCFSILMGTAISNRQPASGVFEQVSSIAKDGATATALMYDGTNQVGFFEAAATVGQVQGNSGAVRYQPYNMATLIGNTVYLRKSTTSDRIAVSGVQVDA